ncbi:hypothetical protein FHY55_11815 [Oceanicola sp. D3]|uniref:ATP-grasp fold amidoligase family protein n=1 Tax=Oceanicola sp. D3 TaxID=2587163 RepID=UPI00111D0E74|nr:ATP-grasp fold amidoligase family protein [Oceanicola sp. D3]QDC09890.1 hypothetical protein FHY55_11815 [Oceanicola sp. D3]
MAREFHEQAFYNKRDRESMGDGFVREYLRDYWDWFRDNLKDAPKVPGDQWMTCLSELGLKETRAVAKRGIGAYYRSTGLFPDFSQPRRFTEMMLLNSLISPMPRLNAADKLNVGHYIPEHLRERIQPCPVEKVFENQAEFDLSSVPEGTYFLKTNHGSSQNIRCDLSGTLDDETSAKIDEKLPKWFDEPYGTASSQWWYRLIDRKVFLERSIARAEDEIVPDFRFHCINGTAALLQVDVGLGTSQRNNAIYDKDLNYIAKPFLRPNRAEVPLPAVTQEARDIAQEISKPFPYIRVDIYVRGDDLFLGELTFLPNAGRRPVRSAYIDNYLCSFWDPMPTVKRVAKVPATASKAA